MDASGSSTTDAMANYPLLVKIQSESIPESSFKIAGTNNRLKTVTCVEASNLFLFIGYASGTVRVYSREKLEYKFMIPFKGGKVCCLSIAENEEDIAIGSIRGQVSLYRILPHHQSIYTSNHNQSTGTPPTLFKHIHTISIHKDNEITELHWSSNGKYLFIGDSQGLVSQVDVGSLEEFPRPVSFSKIILKLRSRVIQIDFQYLYLAVCTVTSVCLCDIENEDYVRFKLNNNRDIRATGISLVVQNLDTESLENIIIRENLFLYISEISTGNLYCFSIDGTLIKSQKIEKDPEWTPYPSQIFDPIQNDEASDSISGPFHGITTTSDISLGKLIYTKASQNLLISATHDHLYIIHPKMMKLIAWSDEFSRIHSVKTIGNFLFIWNSSRLNVISLTEFKPYAQQLFLANKVVFKRFILHTLKSVGWNDDEKMERTENILSELRFKNLLGLNNNSIISVELEQDPFLQYTKDCIPFKLFEPRPITPPPPEDPLIKPFKNFILNLRSDSETNNDLTDPKYTKLLHIWDTIITLYDELNLVPILLSTCQPLTSAVLSIEKFYKENSLVNMYNELNVVLSHKDILFIETEIPKLIDYIYDELSQVHVLLKHFKQEIILEDAVFSKSYKAYQPYLTFTNFAQQESVKDWFSTKKDHQILEDGFLSDCLVLLLPFLPQNIQGEIVCKYSQKSGFCTWLVCSIMCNFNFRKFPYEFPLKSLFNEKYRKLNYIKDVFTTIYRDIVQPDVSLISLCLNHILSIVYFTLKGKKLSKDSKSRKKFVYSLLLNCFPLHHWPTPDIELKIIALCKNNEDLFNIFRKATLLHYNHSSTKQILCKCELPINCGSSNINNSCTSSLSKIQSVAQEAVLELLIQKHLSNSTKNIGPFNKSQVFKYAIRTQLYEPLIFEFPNELSDEIFVEIILRTASCTLLQKLKVSSSNINLLLEKRLFLLKTSLCKICENNLIVPQNFPSITNDCIGMWIYNNSRSSLSNFSKTINDMVALNQAGIFSLQFYHQILEAELQKEKLKIQSQTKIHFPTSCQTLHE